MNMPFDDCRRQSYDNGANIKAKTKKEYKQGFWKGTCMSPMGLILNLVVDAAKNSTDATSFFGNVQKIYTLFSAAP